MIPNKAGSRLDRGQTMPDFVVAIGIFLLTIAFIVSFVPELTVPYQEQENPLIAERATSDLVETRLAASDTPGSLKKSCVLAFFNGTTVPDCEYDTDSPLTDQLGISPQYSVNVTLSRSHPDSAELDVLCANDGSISTCGTDQLSVGPRVPRDNRQVATARRTVYVDGKDAVLRVRVW